MNGLVMGRIVYYVFDSFHASEVTDKRRSSVPPVAVPVPVAKEVAVAKDSKDKDTKEIKPKPDQSQTLETQARIGSEVREGGIFPAIVVKVAADHTDQGVVNLKIMLDGPDEAWARDVYFNSEKKSGTWHWPSIS